MITNTAPRLARLRTLMRTGAAKSIRLDSGVSLPEVARDIGVSHTTIYRWENDMNEPKGDPALCYLDLLDELAEVTP